ncbi:MAG: hypothetical protein IJ686_00700 [Bacteroidales bacterium]|nr:hypothetical protein [Bacteroidales bacterium]
METASIQRRQTAFRLDRELLYSIRKKAKRMNKSLNTYVEEVLRKSVEDEMDGWPVIDGPIEISAEVKRMSLGYRFTPEEIAADERLAYILNK